jgi:hypothetical protein
VNALARSELSLAERAPLPGAHVLVELASRAPTVSTTLDRHRLATIARPETVDSCHIGEACPVFWA